MQEKGGALETLVRRACDGDQDALEALVAALQDRVYGLALRMLWHPEDARDAAQEILVRVVTRLRTFRGESAFLTWVYRVAANHLLDVRRSRMEERAFTFESFGDDLADGMEEAPRVEEDAETALLLEEVKIGCTYGMLLCLDRPHRLAYILGEILELDGREGARVLGISAAAFRKRLERARQAILEFTRAHCGLVNPAVPCRCRRRVRRARELGRIDPSHLLFARDGERARRFPLVLEEIRGLDELRRAAALYRSHPQVASPQDFATGIRNLLAERARI